MKLKRLSWLIAVAPFVLSLTSVAQAPLEIVMDGANPSLRWPGKDRVHYFVEHAEDLAGVSWGEPINAGLGNGTVQEVAVDDLIGTSAPTRAFFRLRSVYPDREDSLQDDMLTPQFYNAPREAAFRAEVNRFVYYAQAPSLHHPLEDPEGQIPSFSVPVNGRFGAAKGFAGTPSQHHPATDMHVGDRETKVSIYAAHDGTVTSFRDAAKYRHYIAVTQSIFASDGELVGRLVTLYAHVDLDLDAADGLVLDGQLVKAGDRISRHLYASTVGGPHLHFEIRYYRPDDDAGTEFYGGVQNPDYTEASADPWSYGVWHPTRGYGYGHPANHGLMLF